MSKYSRRTFIKLAGALAALSNSQPAEARERREKTDDRLKKFDHVVVLMLENRSFDNMLGYLYNDGPFEGVASRNLSNPIPAGADQFDTRKVVPVGITEVMDHPNPDPGEEFPHVNTQLFNTVLPETNRLLAALQMAAPYNLPPSAAASGAVSPTMDGFVTDYINNFQATYGRRPLYDEYKVIMGCFAPESVPVLSTLARQFAVFDHWFCSVPSQTFCNRSFFHAASSTNLVINAPYSDWVKGNDAETVFDRMNASKVSWNVYYDKEDVFPVTAAIHFPRLKSYVPTNFHNMDQFYEDVAAGNLPSYSFIEPRMFYDHNDQHPPAVLQGHVLNSSVLAGEQLINNIYDAIRTSNSARGSNFQNTVLIITYDEHGGCYDHVPPPPAVPPDASSGAGQMDFRFDRLGVRVPTVIVSAWTEPGTIVSAPVHHNSVLKTMSMKWNLGSLTARDATAPDFLEALNRKSPRGSAEWPSITARPWTNPPNAANSDHPLNGLQRGVLGLILQVVKEQDLTAGRIMTVAEAIYYMRKNLPAK